MRPPFLLLAATLLGLDPAAQAHAPPARGLDYVPTTAGAFLSVKVSDLMAEPSLKPAWEAVAKLDKANEGRLTDLFGVSWSEIDRVTLVWPEAISDSEESMTPLIMVTTKAPYNEARLLKSLRATPAEGHGPRRRGVQWVAPKTAVVPETVPQAKAAKDLDLPRPVPPKFAQPGEDGAQERRGPGGAPKPVPAGDPGPDNRSDLYAIERGPLNIVYLVDDRTLLFLGENGATADLVIFAGQLLRRKVDGPLAAALSEADKHTLVAAGRLSPHTRFIEPGEMPREWIPFRSLFRAKVASVTADVKTKVTVHVRLTFADDAAAARAEPVFKTLLQTAVDALVEHKKGLSQDTDWGPVLSPFVDLISLALDKADVKAEGAVVSARAEAELGAAIAKAAAQLPDSIDVLASRTRTANNLKQIGLAIHNFHDTYGHMPTDVLGPDGKPILSWRVLILPFIEQDNIFRQIDMTRAWDDPRNAKFLEQMPAVFRVNDRDAKNKTFFQIPTASQPAAGGDPFQVRGRQLRISGITDGTSNTLMVIEAANAVDWARPDDVAFDPKKLPEFGTAARKKAHVLFGDGSVRQLPRALPADVWRALLTVNGGEVVAIPD